MLVMVDTLTVHPVTLLSSTMKVVVFVMDLGGLLRAHGSGDDETEISTRLTSNGGDVEGGRWWWHLGR